MAVSMDYISAAAKAGGRGFEWAVWKVVWKAV